MKGVIGVPQMAQGFIGSAGFKGVSHNQGCKTGVGVSTALRFAAIELMGRPLHIQPAPVE